MAVSWPLRPKGRRGTELRGSAATTGGWPEATGPDLRPEGERCAPPHPPQARTPRTNRRGRSPGRTGRQQGRQWPR
eukprot:2868409-Alexandrium_andersonii.AAC.1